MKKISEKLLLYRIKVKQDPEAFGIIYDFYIDKIYRFVFFKISHRQEAEDLVSEVFIKVWKYLIEEDKEIKSLSGLIYSTARNTVVDWYRDRAKNLEYPLETVKNVTEIPSAEKGLEEKIIIQNDNEKLLEKIKSLKQDYQEVVLLRFIDELSYSEVAEITGRSPIDVRVTIHRAIKKLKEMMDPSSSEQASKNK